MVQVKFLLIPLPFMGHAGTVVTNTVPGDLPSCRFHLQPKLKTPLYADQELLGVMII